MIEPIIAVTTSGSQYVSMCPSSWNPRSTSDSSGTLTPRTNAHQPSAPHPSSATIHRPVFLQVARSALEPIISRDVSAPNGRGLRRRYRASSRLIQRGKAI